MLIDIETAVLAFSIVQELIPAIAIAENLSIVTWTLLNRDCIVLQSANE